jgi:hypothetical protein
MREFFPLADEFLRGQGRFAVDAPAVGRLKWLILFTFLFGACYGAVMGSFGVCAFGHPRLFAYTLIGALKVPLLLLVTFLLSLPSFFVLNAIFGLRDDFGESLRAVTGMLACLATVLAALAPITLFFYCSCDYYDAAILFNGLMFSIAALASSHVARRYYGPLIRRSPRHKTMLLLWLGLYTFVAIQMAWTLRPFIGDPNPQVPIVLMRSGEIDNAYLEIVRLMRQVIRMWFG